MATLAVSHVPQEICWYFLQKSGSEMTRITSGDDASKLS